MKTHKKILILVLILLVIAATGIGWVLINYHVIGFHLYPKNASALDLRGETISVAQYEQLQQAMPDCYIQWDVPFQSGLCASDSAELTIPDLTAAEAELLPYLPGLKTLHIEACEDHSLLFSLIHTYPELEIVCSVPIDGQLYAPDTTQLQLDNVTAEDVDFLTLLSDLTLITVKGSCDAEPLKTLRDHCFGNGIELRIAAGEHTFSSKDTSLTVENITDAQILPLSMMTQLETLHLPEPEAGADSLLMLVDALPTTEVSWEKTVLGVTYPHDTVEIDLTDIVSLAEGQVPGDETAYQKALNYPILGTEEEVRSSAKVSKFHPLPDKTESTEQLIEEIESAMAYFPHAEKLVMCGTILDNEKMSDFRERHRADYKVVWSVQCGELATRTDTKFFMPTKYHVYYFFTKDTPNLKYCEEVEAVDIGHMLVDDISFVEYMPNLKYLILTLTSIVDISPLATCKNLVFLEMDWNRVTDYSPLIGCTSLEDLNIGETYGDIAPVLEMPWLKNLWLVGKSHEYIRAAKEGLPNTHIGAYYDNPDDGWRQLPNYFAMRDALLMFYML